MTESPGDSSRKSAGCGRPRFTSATKGTSPESDDAESWTSPGPPACVTASRPLTSTGPGPALTSRKRTDSEPSPWAPSAVAVSNLSNLTPGGLWGECERLPGRLLSDLVAPLDPLLDPLLLGGV